MEENVVDVRQDGIKLLTCPFCKKALTRITTSNPLGLVSIDIITGKPNDLGLFQCWEIKLGQRITKGGDNE